MDEYTTPRPSDTVLIAYATVHLESGESFELLPFEDANDVKSRVCDLIEDWARSGYLVAGNLYYPWHRVRRVEVTKVLEVPRIDAERLRQTDGREEKARQQRSFWRTKHARVRESRDQHEKAM
ncbi:MAG TPA: hypothetical protein VFJ10_13155 [Acidobacteriaceae bacterium]|nr:hypothetical protein [Acidobacteriaceae bacterium]